MVRDGDINEDQVKIDLDRMGPSEEIVNQVTVNRTIVDLGYGKSLCAPSGKYQVLSIWPFITRNVSKKCGREVFLLVSYKFPPPRL